LAGSCLLGVVLLGTGLYRTDRGVQERVKRTLFERDTQYNADPRLHLWKAQFHILMENRWIGVGYNNNERKSKEYIDRLYPEVEEKFYGHAHSTPLQILSTTGVLGFLVFLWLWIAIFKRNWTLYKTYPRGSLEKAISLGLLAGFIGFHIQGLTQWNFGDAEVLHNLMFFWAVLATLPEQSG